MYVTCNLQNVQRDRFVFAMKTLIQKRNIVNKKKAVDSEVKCNYFVFILHIASYLFKGSMKVTLRQAASGAWF